MEATLTMHAYCGMSNRLIERRDRETMEAARSIAARIIRSRRATGHCVSILEKGRSWEFGEPADCVLIPDTAGTLSLDEVWRCDYCGRETEPGNVVCERCDDERLEWECRCPGCSGDPGEDDGLCDDCREGEDEG